MSFSLIKQKEDAELGELVISISFKGFKISNFNNLSFLLVKKQIDESKGPCSSPPYKIQ